MPWLRFLIETTQWNSVNYKLINVEREIAASLSHKLAQPISFHALLTLTLHKQTYNIFLLN